MAAFGSKGCDVTFHVLATQDEPCATWTPDVWVLVAVLLASLVDCRAYPSNYSCGRVLTNESYNDISAGDEKDATISLTVVVLLVKLSVSMDWEDRGWLEQ